MDESNQPKCSRDIDAQYQEDSLSEHDNQHLNDTISKASYPTNILRTPTFSTASTNTLFTFDPKNDTCNFNRPLVIKPSNQINESSDLRRQILPSITPTTTCSSYNQPPSLFIQALSKLNESPVTFSVNHLRILQSFNQSLSNLSKVVNIDLRSGETTPPNSIENAPPSYTFVLRQMAAQKRPRFMGTFIPSPSFVQHTPPPTYTTAFDIYIDPGPPPPRRIYSFGFTPMPVICSECGYAGITMIQSKVIACTHVCAIVLCLICCWVCAPLPYFLTSCKEVYHYCSNCRHFLGMYSPTNPERAHSRMSIMHPQAQGLRRQRQR